MKRLKMTSPPTPHATITWCPICGLEIHRDFRDDFRTRATIAAEIEDRIVDHLADEHPIRYWLWRRLKRKWILGVWR